MWQGKLDLKKSETEMFPIAEDKSATLTQGEALLERQSVETQLKVCFPHPIF